MSSYCFNSSTACFSTFDRFGFCGLAQSFLINQKACSCNVINRKDGANFPAVYSVFVSNVFCILQHFLLVPTPVSVK